MYTISKQIIKFNNPCTPITVKGIVVHETANPNDTAQMEHDYFNSGDRQASAHAFIDSSNIIQCIEWGNKAWHAGGTANNSFIGIELCHTSDLNKFNEIWKRATWLFATLLLQNNIFTVSKDNLISHAEVSAKWHETDHTDPVSYFASFNKTVENFRADVQTQINILIQQALINKGYRLNADGIIGNMSRKQIMAFQQANNLVADGIVGPMTWSKLKG